LGSYTAQAELGDYNEYDNGPSYDYLKELQFAPVQDDELLRRIHEQHKRHKYVYIDSFVFFFFSSLEFIEVNHLMLLIYIFWKMQKNWPCMVLIFIQHK
jgi:hypothetical protein